VMPGLKTIEVFADKAELIKAIDARFEETVCGLLREQPVVHVVLTGGTVGIAMLEPIDTNHKLDWSRIHLWWGDERFVASGNPDRNEGQAQRALIHRLPIPPENIHRMASTDAGLSLDQAAASYAEELASFAKPGDAAPAFDVLILGIGPDAHVASLFPGHAGVTDNTAAAIAVRNSPKPPPERVSLALTTINKAQRVWVVAAGADKAEAVDAAFAASNASAAPASAVEGTLETIFFTDEAAAAEVISS
jgi:6-phosphogluconolactonase